jgi:hypothetical protein
LNLAFGYEAEGMIGEKEENSTPISSPKLEEKRQFYLSLDVDLTKIETKSHFLKTFFSVFNTLKIPVPSLEYSTLRGFKFYALYFYKIVLA